MCMFLSWCDKGQGACIHIQNYMCVLRLGGEKVVQWSVDQAPFILEEEEEEVEVLVDWVKQFPVSVNKKGSSKMCV